MCFHFLIFKLKKTSIHYYYLFKYFEADYQSSGNKYPPYMNNSGECMKH